MFYMYHRNLVHVSVGHISRPSTGSYKIGRRVSRVWQLDIDTRKTLSMYVI